MPTIKITAEGKVITKGGLPSCTCCGSCNITWDTSVYYGQNNGNPWTVSNGGSRLRFDLEDSENCGGSNNNTQSGTATATIAVVGSEVELDFSFSGIGELQLSGFENIFFYLDENLIASATSAGGELGCEMGEIVAEFFVEPPYILTEGEHTLRVEFDSADELFHVGSYYQANFTCKTVTP
jgi:hypothetical protein